MKTVILKVGREKVMDEARMLTAYAGKAAAEALQAVRGEGQGTRGEELQAYERLFMGEGEGEDMKRLWDEALAWATELLMHNAQCVTNKDGRERIMVEVGDQWPEVYRDEAESALKRGMEWEIAGQWLQMMGEAEKGTAWRQEARMLLAEAVSLLNWRERPKKH